MHKLKCKNHYSCIAQSVAPLFMANNLFSSVSNGEKAEINNINQSVTIFLFRALAKL